MGTRGSSTSGRPMIDRAYEVQGWRWLAFVCWFLAGMIAESLRSSL